MGKTTNSAKTGFGREIGKNTAKVISNKVFGDSWSTPHKVAISVEREKEKQKTQKIISDTENKKLRHEKDLNFQKQIEMIATIQFDEDSKQISNEISKLVSYAFSCIDDMSEENKKLLLVCNSKIEEGIYRLGVVGDLSSQQYYSKKFDEIKMKIEKIEKKGKISNILMYLLMIPGLVMLFYFYKWIYTLITNF